jgi:transcriptional regulator with XRE-family HTH domain
MNGSRLREQRTRAALSQDDLAKEAGLTKSAVNRIETGKSLARPSTIGKLAEALGVKPEEFTV